MRTHSAVAIVNKAFVDRYWPGQNAIGKSVEFYGRPLTVVGVAANAKYRRLTDDPSPLVLLPLMQDSRSPVILQRAHERGSHGICAGG